MVKTAPQGAVFLFAGTVTAKLLAYMPMQEPNSLLKWPVSVEQEIAAPAHEAWNVISRPGSVELCHPFCARNPVQLWSGQDSRDEVHYLSGRIYERRFRRWLEGTGYDLDIFKSDDALASVSWRISPIDEQNCKLRITIYPYALQKYPVVIRWLPHFLRLRPMLSTYLESVVKGFEWYITRGEPVPRNQFGKHPWFSASKQTAD